MLCSKYTIGNTCSIANTLNAAIWRVFAKVLPNEPEVPECLKS